MLVHSFLMSHFVHSIKLKSLTPFKSLRPHRSCCLFKPGHFSLCNVTLNLPPPPQTSIPTPTPSTLWTIPPTIPTQECIQTLNSNAG